MSSADPNPESVAKHDPSPAAAEESSPAANGSVFPKADIWLRLLARSVDMLIFGVLARVYPLGVLVGLLYLLVADGFMDGRSPGKRLIGLKVRRESGALPIGFKESLLRNLPFAIVALFALIPIVGWLLFFLVGLPIVGVELYLAVRDARGQRAGDIIARTVVVAAPKLGSAGSAA